MKKRFTAWLVCLAMLLSVSACAPGPETTTAEESYGLWFAVDGDSARRDLPAIDMEHRVWEEPPTAEQLLRALLEGPRSEHLKTPFPEGVSLRSVFVDKFSRTAQVDLSEQYGGLAGVDLTVADYCITLTLCQLSEINSVRIRVEGQYISYRDRQQMRTGDVLFSGIDEEPKTFLAALYFPNQRGSLTAEYRQVSRGEESSPARIVLQELQRGSSTGLLERTLPMGTQILSVEVEKGVCKVNLSREFLTNRPRVEKDGALMVYALANSLCSLAGINQVQLLVEGQKVENYGGVSIAGPIGANYDLAVK